MKHPGQRSFIPRKLAVLVALALSGAAHAEVSHEGIGMPITFERNVGRLPADVRLPLAGANLNHVTNNRRFGEVQLKGGYPGADRALRGRDGVLEDLDLSGADEIVLDVDGNVLLARGDARLMQQAPIAFQDGAAGRHGVAAGFGQPRGFAGKPSSDATSLIDSEFVGGSPVSVGSVRFDPMTGDAVIDRMIAANNVVASPVRGSDARAARLARTGTPYSTYLGASGSISAAERAVLTSLYTSTNGASWFNKTNWLGASGTECTWYGVICDAGQNNVLQINLAGNNLSGSLPSLAGLSALQSFSAYGNSLTGSIPSLSSLTALQQLDIGQNQLTGSIPSLSGLTALRQFDAGDNQLTGPIPSLSGLAALQQFDVYHNQLTGSIPSLSGLNALQQFEVGQNQLTGSIPALGGLPALQYILADHNQLSGPVPQPPPSLAAGQSTLCGNMLTSSGSSAIDAAWNAATGVNWIACELAPPAPPVCNISASRGSVSAGTAVTLTAACNPAATSYAWTGGTCNLTTTASCTTAPAVTTTYTVRGSNNDGTGAAASAVITVTAQVFPIQATSNITPTSSTATAQIQPAPADVGRTQSVFVFAHAPQSLLAKVAAKHGLPGLPARNLDGSDLCVLAQADANGILHGVTPQTMQAYLTGILAAQGQSVSVLNSIPTPDVAGASFFVGYGSSAPTMISNGNYQGVVTVNGNGQVQCTAAIAAPAAPHIPDELTGLWWNANESGWGIHFTQRKNAIFAAWYTYDSAGNPKWYVATCNMPGSQATITGTCTGTLLEVSAPGFFGRAFDPSLVHSTNAGDLQVTFTSANAASMTYHAGVQTRTIALTRQPLGTGSTQPAVNNTDLWWNSTESGWGMAMAQQYGVNFLAWYVYDTSGNPTWFVSTCIVSGSGCTGTLYRTTGPALGPTFNPNAVQATSAGTITVNFQDGNNAVINYTVDGVSATKMITRQLF